MSIVFYLVAIVIANVITGITQPIQIWVFLIPWGTWFVGATFLLRDLVQQKYGRKNTYIIILIAFFISAIMSFFQGSILPITIASVIAYLVSESSDTEVFTRLKTSNGEGANSRPVRCHTAVFRLLADNAGRVPRQENKRWGVYAGIPQRAARKGGITWFPGQGSLF